MRITVVCLGVLLAMAVATARADNPPAQQPWTVGVSAEQKANARSLLDAGNELFIERKYAEALEQYRQAVKTWDHPAIRFNIVRCLIQLEKPLEAFEQVKLALAYGAAPFDDTIYNEAVSYEKLLANQIGELEVSCTQPGAALTLDGQPLPVCPGTHKQRVLPGPHQVVGTKQGFVPRTTELVVLGGKQDRVEVTLVPLAKVAKGARIEHRWPQWIPWTVFGSGFVIAGIGELLHLKATNDNDAYERLVERECPNGCTAGDVDESLQSRARIENGFGIGAMLLGAAVVVGGGVMIYMNRGETVYDVNEVQPARGGRLGIVPLRDGGALSWSARF